MCVDEFEGGGGQYIYTCPMQGRVHESQHFSLFNLIVAVTALKLDCPALN